MQVAGSGVQGAGSRVQALGFGVAQERLTRSTVTSTYAYGQHVLRGVRGVERPDAVVAVGVGRRGVS